MAELLMAFTDAMLAELTALGSHLLIGIAISSLLEIKQIRVDYLLLGLLIAPLLVASLVNLGLN